MVRLQRVLAQAGHGSRRECEALIVEGRVTVDGKMVTELGVRVDAENQKVLIDGTRVNPIRLQYFMVNKPTGVLSTCRDPEGRMRVIDLINTDQRVYNVGRLDKSSEGLILVTNDGELANRLTHPRYGVQKTYMVTVAGSPGWDDLQMLKRGIRLAEAVARVSEVKIKKRRRDSCDLIIVLDEGRNREIRRLLAHIGHKVTRLCRIAIGPLQLGDLRPGDYRRLEPAEIDALLRASSMVQGKKPREHKPVESSQVGRSRKSSKKRATDGKTKTGAKTGTVEKAGTRRKSATRTGPAKRKSPARKKGSGKKKGGGKKKRVSESGSRRGSGRQRKLTSTATTTRKKGRKKKSTRSSVTGKRAASNNRPASSRASSQRKSGGKGRPGGKGKRR